MNCFNKEYWKYFTGKLREPVPGFPAWKYWLDHAVIGIIINFICLLVFIPEQVIIYNHFIDFSRALIIGTEISIIYIIIHEIKDILGDNNFRDSITDINQTLIFNLPLTLYFNQEKTLGGIVFLFQIFVFYITIKWTHQ